MYEITHFVIYSEMDDTFLHVAPQQRAIAQQIKDDAPARDLGMMVAARVVLPTVSESIDARSL